MLLDHVMKTAKLVSIAILQRRSIHDLLYMSTVCQTWTVIAGLETRHSFIIVVTGLGQALNGGFGRAFLDCLLEIDQLFSVRQTLALMDRY
jgi:hypothetical protein